MIYPDPDSPRRFTRRDAYWLLGIALVVVMVVTRLEGVLIYRWDWGFLPEALWAVDAETGAGRPNLLLAGLLSTIRLSFWAMLLAALLGLLLGILSTRQRLLARLFSRSFVMVIRNTPPLVLIFVFYFFISSQLMPVFGIDQFVREASPATQAWMSRLLGPPELFENLLSGVICLALFEAVYIAEIVRAGLESIPQGQSEGARSLGLSHWQGFRRVILPQALHSVVPALANQFILLIKDSALVSLISVQELTFIGTEVAVSTSRRFETWIVVAAMYFLLCQLLASAFSAWERRQRRQRT